MEKTAIKSAGYRPAGLPRRFVASKPREVGSLGEAGSAEHRPAQRGLETAALPPPSSVVLWSYGPMVLWSIVPWSYGPMVLWSSGQIAHFPRWIPEPLYHRSPSSSTR